MPFGLKVSFGPQAKIEMKRVIGLKQIIRRSARHAFFDLGAALKKEADNQVLRTPKTGRVYFIRGPSGKRRRHVSSAPGESHANRSGRLRRSIGWKVSGFNELNFGYGVTEEAPPYADAEWGSVEEGTKGGQMEPRPTIENSVKAVGDGRVDATFNDAMTRALRGFGG